MKQPSLNQFLLQLREGMRTRFAPSPTGYLHRGHLLSALFVWAIARHCKTEVILRIEDHDQSRSRQKFDEAILEDLDWLDLGPYRLVRQSEHWERYQSVLSRLKDAVYYCECSRKMLPLRGEELWYPGSCRTKQLQAGSLRLRWPDTFQAVTFEDAFVGTCHQDPRHQCGDLLLKDREGNYTYQLAVVVDDLAEDVDVVVRGQDLLASTGRQLWLRQILAPEAKKLNFLHHPLLFENDGRKLAKRDGSKSLRDLRAMGLTADELIGEVLHAAGLTENAQARSSRWEWLYERAQSD